MLILRWFCNAAALLLVAYLVPGIQVSSFYTALIVAVVLGILNATMKPILILLTLPINILTLGLFTFVVNALIFWFASTIVKGFSVDGFVPAFIGTMFLGLVSLITGLFRRR